MISTWNISTDLQSIFEIAEQKDDTIAQNPFRITSDAFVEFREKKKIENSGPLTTALTIYPFDRIYDEYYQKDPETCHGLTEGRHDLTELNSKAELFFSIIKLKSCTTQVLKVCEFLSQTYPNLRSSTHKAALILSPVIKYADETAEKLYDTLNNSPITILGIEHYYDAHLRNEHPSFTTDRPEITSEIRRHLLQKEKDLRAIFSVIEKTNANTALCKIAFFKTALDYGFYNTLKFPRAIHSKDENDTHTIMCQHLRSDIIDITNIKRLSIDSAIGIAELVKAVHNRDIPYNVMNRRKLP